jgi:hypothetical protein
MKVLEQLSKAQEAERGRAWRRYRQLLERANAANGELPKADQSELAELLEALDLTVTDARIHADALKRHATAVLKVAELADVTAKQKSHENEIAVFNKRYMNVVAPLELEGQLLAAKTQELQNKVSVLIWQEGKASELESKFPDLFGIIPPTMPTSTPLKSIAAINDEARLADLRDRGMRVAAMFRDSGYSPDVMDNLKGQFYAAYELGIIDAPHNCRAEIVADFPLWIARQIRTKSRTRDDLPPLAAKALEAAIEAGIIDAETLKPVEVVNAVD